MVVLLLIISLAKDPFVFKACSQNSEIFLSLNKKYIVNNNKITRIIENLISDNTEKKSNLFFNKQLKLKINFNKKKDPREKIVKKALSKLQVKLTNKDKQNGIIFFKSS